MQQFAGQVAFVTGAASGIGLGIARALAAEGALIVVNDLDAPRLEEAARSLSNEGATVLALPFDITDRNAWAASILQTEQAFGPVTLLFNNAGVSASGRRVGELDGDLWDRCNAINLTGVFNGCSQVVPRMRAHGRPAHIVNTASMSGLIATAGQAAYNATKFAVVALTETLAQELAGTEIGVSVLCPGPVRSLLWQSSPRAQGLPSLDVPPPQSLAGGSASAEALDPALVARLVLSAIRERRRYILTHPDRWPTVAARFADIERDFDWCRVTLADQALTI
jgi:NAD(P)-dependent dehydrogenase (short-subunit alcohol dehydrogenase family)